MGVLYDALMGLSPEDDAELRDGYQRYEDLLATILTADQMERYAQEIQQSGAIRIFEEMSAAELASLSPEMQAIARAVMDHETISMENRRVVALLHQRGQETVAPDFGSAQQDRHADSLRI